MQFNLRILLRNYTRFICRNSYFNLLKIFFSPLWPPPLICVDWLNRLIIFRNKINQLEKSSSIILAIQNVVVWIQATLHLQDVDLKLCYNRRTIFRYLGITLNKSSLYYYSYVLRPWGQESEEWKHNLFSVDCYTEKYSNFLMNLVKKIALNFLHYILKSLSWWL